jgi:hypothetical protein
MTVERTRGDQLAHRAPARHERLHIIEHRSTRPLCTLGLAPVPTWNDITTPASAAAAQPRCDQFAGDAPPVTGTTARARSYYQVLMPHGLDHWGRYLDEFGVHDGRWLFTHRRVTVDGRGPDGWATSAGR